MITCNQIYTWQLYKSWLQFNMILMIILELAVWYIDGQRYWTIRLLVSTGLTSLGIIYFAVSGTVFCALVRLCVQDPHHLKWSYIFQFFP